jgi:hypothetical protein
LCDTAALAAIGASTPPVAVAKPGRDSLRRESIRSWRFRDTKEDSMLIGYARVSTADQKLDLQYIRGALRAAGCDKIFADKVSGAGAPLPARTELLDYARRGDVAVVWKLDRLGRSLLDLVDIVNALAHRGVGLRSLHESIDTTTPAGKLTFHVFAALAEFEADIVRERTCAGRQARTTADAHHAPARDGAHHDGQPEAVGPAGRRAARRPPLHALSESHRSVAEPAAARLCSTAAPLTPITNSA